MAEGIERSLASAAAQLNAGRPRETEAICRTLLQEHGPKWQLYGLLAQAATTLNQHNVAAEHLRSAISLNPTHWQLHNALGIAVARLGRPVEAALSFQEALRFRPSDAGILTNLANALKSQGQLDEAIAVYRRAIQIATGIAGAYNGLGHALELKGDARAAAEYCRKALALDPGLAEAHINLGRALQSQGDAVGALNCYQAAAPKLPVLAAQNTAAVLAAQGRATEAVDSAREALAANPVDAEMHSHLLYLLNGDPRTNRRLLREEHTAWANRHAARFYPPSKRWENDRNPERRLRIGYVSPDFRSHAVMAFLEPILRGHDRTRFEVVCYSDVRSPDAVTRRLASCVDSWRDISKVSDEEAAQQIESDRIDILVDLCGHMRGNRLLLFARKPAPLQASYFTYPCTSGLSTIDYRVTDAHQDPVGSERFYTETLARLSPISWCYMPWTDGLVSEPPVSSNGYVTFGSLNHPKKLNSEVIAVWARILQCVPRSRLLLRSAGAGTISDWIVEQFSRHGVPSGHVNFVGKQNLDRYLATFEAIDIALDPFPYNGHTTSCDALWSGVPVVAIEGQLAVSRVGASILSTLGMNDLIATDQDAYVQIAVSTAVHIGQPRQLRAALRERMRSSALADYPGCVARLQEALRGMWQVWCEQ